jgi:glycosyltransferase involved in cell wall biosynthesis
MVLVSIIISSYNYDSFLEEAIDSTLSQNYPHKEIIVVDDGSTDDSRSIIQSYSDKIIPIFQKNAGQASAFNAGFLLSKGEIVCFLDADDAFLPEKLDEVVTVFEQNAEIGWCFHPLKLLEVGTNRIIPPSWVNPSPGNWDLRNSMKRGSLKFISPATSGTCFRRFCLSKILPMPEEIRIVSDNYVKFLASAFFKGYFLNKELAIQKIHGSNAYTLRQDSFSLGANFALLTAYYMQQRHPNLQTFSDNLAASAIVMTFKVKEPKHNLQDLIQTYLESVGILRSSAIYCRVIFKLFKFIIEPVFFRKLD